MSWPPGQSQLGLASWKASKPLPSLLSNMSLVSANPKHLPFKRTGNSGQVSSSPLFIPLGKDRKLLLGMAAIEGGHRCPSRDLPLNSWGGAGEWSVISTL